jgi:hypothetical protein
MSSLAVAVTATLPETCAPSAGPVMATLGGATSSRTATLVSFDGVLRLPFASSAVTT